MKTARTVFFDCRSGASPEALLGALAAFGLDLKVLEQELRQQELPFLKGINLKCRDVDAANGVAKSVKISCALLAIEEDRWSAVDAIDCVEELQLSDSTKNKVRTVFARMLEAQARARGSELSKLSLPVAQIMDPLIEIIAFAIAYDLLQIEQSFCAPLLLNWHEHLLQPGIADLLAEAQAAVTVEGADSRDIENGQLTLCGAALLTTFVVYWSMPAFTKLEKAATGAEYAPAQIGFSPAFCHVLLGESASLASDHTLPDALISEQFGLEKIIQMETNLDDLSPQIISFTIEELLSAGALDAFVMPCVMKKGRSGHLLTVLSKIEDRDKILSVLFAQTTTLGVRMRFLERVVAERKWHTVEIDGVPIRVKVGSDVSGKVLNIQPEYEDCAAYARKTKSPLKDVMRQAVAKFNESKLRSIHVPHGLIIGILLAASVLFLACMPSAQAESEQVSESPANWATFRHSLHSAKPGTLKGFKGFELYSWYVGTKWHYSLLPGTNRNKSAKEVTETGVTYRNLNQLETALGKLAPTSVIVWHNTAAEPVSVGQFSYPHKAVVNALKHYADSRHLKLVTMGTSEH